MSRAMLRTIRGQLIASIVVLQLALVLLFIFVLLRSEKLQMRQRRQASLDYQTRSLAALVATPLADREMTGVYRVLRELRADPTTTSVRITDLDGNLIAYEDRFGGREAPPLLPQQRAVLPRLRTDSAGVALNIGVNAIAADPVVINGRVSAIAWLSRDNSGDDVQLQSFLKTALTYSWLTLMGNLGIALLLTRLIGRPVQSLLAGTRAMTRGNESGLAFPLRVRDTNELGDLTKAFNSMVASLREQRAGLRETLALLDSLLANAPIGFAFFDRNARFVRINEYLAAINGVPMNQHVGRNITDVLSADMAAHVGRMLDRVFATGVALADVEMHGVMPAAPGNERSWLTSFYPIRTIDQQVRWVGAVFVEITERKQSEEMLRRSEKLAAAGRLAASIAHEINNPLEAITNLLFLLRSQPSLDAEARNYADMAQAEIARVSQITQQTLRFYRQATHPAEASLAELLDSVLALHQGRAMAAHVNIESRYSAKTRILCFAGEMRQLFANLVGNAIDAMPAGGRLRVTVRDSTSWTGLPVPGIRISVADTGTGMTRKTRQRIFEPFFTTKEITGTGLGLWVSAEIIAKHSGVIRVASRIGEHSGTVFMLFFPHNGLRAGTDRRPALSAEANRSAEDQQKRPSF